MRPTPLPPRGDTCGQRRDPKAHRKRSTPGASALRPRILLLASHPHGLGELRILLNGLPDMVEQLGHDHHAGVSPDSPHEGTLLSEGELPADSLRLSLLDGVTLGDGLVVADLPVLLEGRAELRVLPRNLAGRTGIELAPSPVCASLTPASRHPGQRCTGCAGRGGSRRGPRRATTSVVQAGRAKQKLQYTWGTRA